MQLCDVIEQFIKSLLSDGERQVELKRNELAVYFRCAPSQINYVLATRFSLENGYIIESRRGGGGYIRIVRVNEGDDEQFIRMIYECVGDAISRKNAAALLSRLCERGWVNAREARLLMSALDDNALALPLNIKERLRADILKSMLKALIQEKIHACGYESQAVSSE